MEKKYLVIVNIQDEILKKEVIECNSLAEAYNLWRKNPIESFIVKKVGAEVKEIEL